MSCTLVIPELCGGGTAHDFFWLGLPAEFAVKTGLIKLVHNIFSYIFCFDNKLLKSKVS
jgi:hypothetical protein